ncbi:MAG: cytochrome-c peroxidase [Chitinophagaceae bacterium]|nr:cytochrome-c peroxidase [Chitinophagaceae bacterium]
MRKSLLTIFILFFVCVLFTYLLGSCKKEQNTKGIQLMQQEIPAGFPAPLHTFNDNPLSKEGFELGRKLFYDERLSIDNQHPCSSCHQQIAGFGTFEHDRSHGVNNSHTLRNAPVLFNLAWSPFFHWDGEFTTLQDEAAQPINGHIEMGESFEGVINKIKDDQDYQEQFKKVFRSPFIRPEFILKALEQFTGYMVSADSKYDRYKKGTATLTVQENAGYQLYKINCATCHPEPMFTDHKLHNTGLAVDPFLNDFGRMRITNKKEDSLKFRTPTLRNTYISSNYMHDGRFNTIGQCINHYRTGVQASSTLDPLLTNGITLTDTEANNLFVFLRALTDSAFLRDTRFSKPQ